MNLVRNLQRLNARQWQLVYQSMVGMAGPLAKFVSLFFAIPETIVKAKIDAGLDLIMVVTPIISLVWMVATSTNSDQFKNVAAMPEEDKAKAAAQLTPQALASIATAFPDEAKVASIIAMPAEATAIAVANLSTQDQAAVAAALPDKAIVTAVGLMEDVRVKVGANAPEGAKEAARDESVVGVKLVV